MKLKELVEKYGDYTVPNELIEKLEKPTPKTIWDLKNGDECYYIDVFGDIEDTGGYLSPLSEAVESGNVFLTEEEAEKEIERRKVETLLLKYGGRRLFKRDTSNWVIRYNHIQGSFEYGYLNYTQYSSCIYFDTKGQAQNAVQEIGEDRIKESLFEVR